MEAYIYCVHLRHKMLLIYQTVNNTTLFGYETFLIRLFVKFVRKKLQSENILF